MNQPFDPSALAFLFLLILRLGIPLAFTILLVWLFRRLDAHWQAQAVRSQPTANQQLSSQEDSAGAAYPELVDRPCWEYRACSESKRKNCPACGANVVCWLARLRHDGRLPSMCRTCPIFTTTSPVHAAQSGDD